ncbi:MAG: metallophosphoesterase [Balneolaceae bacterium]|nr:metallophosphoesterase [Balneolaceae bacterium]
MPGNHDYITEDSQLWDRFKKEAGGNVLVLDKKEPVDLSEYDLNAVVWPAPCHAKHSAENAVGWVKDEEKDPDKVHIGIAHGSIEGVSPDFNQQYFPMTVRELNSSGVDIWLMGHTHITFPEKPGKRISYSIRAPRSRTVSIAITKAGRFCILLMKTNPSQRRF